jgi:transcriptional regulator with XRE-family HTH domain
VIRSESDVSSLKTCCFTKIRNIRKTKALTQEEFAENAGLLNSYIGGIERGDVMFH